MRQLTFFSRLLIALCLLYPSILSGQCNLETSFFSVNERLNFDVYFNWKFVWVKAADAEIKSYSTAYKGTNAYRTILSGKTKGLVHDLYSVNDTLTSYVSSSDLTPLFYSKVAHEGKSYNAYEEISYDYSDTLTTVKARLKSWRDKKLKKNVSLTSQKCFYDAVTLLYFIRSLNPEKMPVNGILSIPVLFTDESFNVKITYKGPGTIDVDGEKIKTVKYSLAIGGKVFENKKESLFVWLSNDQNRLPVMIETKLKVGSIKAMLKKASGYRNACSAFPAGSKIAK